MRRGWCRSPVHGAGAAVEPDEPVPLDRGLPGDGFLCLGDLLADAAQRPPRTVVVAAGDVQRHSLRLQAFGREVEPLLYLEQRLGLEPPRYRVVVFQQLRGHGTQAVIEEAIEQALNGPEMIYISLDIDVLDPGFAPDRTNPEPGGMTPGDLLWTMQRLVEATNVIAMDVVEVCPPCDSSELAAQHANRAVMQVLSALAVKRRKAVQPGLSAHHSGAE
jgi:hypothetical protein